MLTLVSVAAIVGVLLASGAVYCLRHSSHYRLKERLSGLGAPGPDATAAYQVRCSSLPGVLPITLPGPGPALVRYSQFGSL